MIAWLPCIEVLFLDIMLFAWEPVMKNKSLVCSASFFHYSIPKYNCPWWPWCWTPRVGSDATIFARDRRLGSLQSSAECKIAPGSWISAIGCQAFRPSHCFLFKILDTWQLTGLSGLAMSVGCLPRLCFQHHALIVQSLCVLYVLHANNIVWDALLFGKHLWIRTERIENMFSAQVLNTVFGFLNIG